MSQPMKAEIISIGTELTTGQNLDTHSQWLSVRLAELGIPVGFHTTVADQLADNVAVMRTAVERAELVIITGGLGPTQDDLTREALAEVAGVELVFHEPTLKHIQSLFARFSRTMPERNRVQAHFPAGSDVIPNPVGTAPGIWMQIPRRRAAATAAVIAMPGVPSEMFRMFDHEVRPRLEQLGGRGRVILRRKINCFGAGESAVEEMLGDLTRRGRDPEVGITVHDATISLRITAEAATAEEARAKVEETAREVYARLGDLVLGEADEDVQHVVARLLAESGTTLSAVEGFTGGLLSHRLTEILGANARFRGGLLTPIGASHFPALGAAPGIDEGKHQTETDPIAALAAACRDHFKSDLALAIGWPAGTSAAGADHPDVVPIGLATPEGRDVRPFRVVGDPAILRSRCAKQALNMVRLYFQKRRSQTASR